MRGVLDDLGNRIESQMVNGSNKSEQSISVKIKSTWHWANNGSTSDRYYSKQIQVDYCVLANQRRVSIAILEITVQPHEKAPW